MAEPVIADAVVAPGHDGQAVLVVRVRHANGALDTVMLDADQARKLLDHCAAESAAQLCGQPWTRFLTVLGDAPGVFSTGPLPVGSLAAVQTKLES